MANLSSISITEARTIAREHNAGRAVVPMFAISSMSAGDALALHTDCKVLVRKGTTDEFDSCELCGKTGLRKTVVFRVSDGGDDIHVGTDCAESIKWVRWH